MDPLEGQWKSLSTQQRREQIYLDSFQSTELEEHREHSGTLLRLRGKIRSCLEEVATLYQQVELNQLLRLVSLDLNFQRLLEQNRALEARYTSEPYGRTLLAFKRVARKEPTEVPTEPLRDLPDQQLAYKIKTLQLDTLQLAGTEAQKVSEELSQLAQKVPFLNGPTTLVEPLGKVAKLREDLAFSLPFFVSAPDEKSPFKAAVNNLEQIAAEAQYLEEYVQRQLDEKLEKMTEGKSDTIRQQYLRLKSSLLKARETLYQTPDERLAFGKLYAQRLLFFVEEELELKCRSFVDLSDTKGKNFYQLFHQIQAAQGGTTDFTITTGLFQAVAQMKKIDSKQSGPFARALLALTELGKKIGKSAVVSSSESPSWDKILRRERLTELPEELRISLVNAVSATFLGEPKPVKLDLILHNLRVHYEEAFAVWMQDESFSKPILSFLMNKPLTFGEGSRLSLIFYNLLSDPEAFGSPFPVC